MSYESFGIMVGGSGGATTSGGVVPDCPPVTSTFMPPGIKNHDTVFKQVCDASNANAALCNTTADPGSCYHAREHNMSFKNRVSPGEITAWRAWSPAGSGPQILGDFRKGIPGAATPGGAPTTSDDNTMLYVGLGLGVGALVLIGGAVWYKKKKKMAANRRSGRH
jgi:LPXTG-motif cell wall-anchored protein